MSEPEVDRSLLSATIGTAIRAERTKRGWSMRTLAAKADVSQPFLSNVENGRLSPSVASLYALAGALGVPPATLMPDARGSADGAAAVHLPMSELPDAPTTRLLAGGAGRLIEAYLFDVEPGYVDASDFEHDGEDFLFVLDGEVTLEATGAPTRPLTAGESLWIDARRPHRWSVPVELPSNARFLLISANRGADRDDAE